MEKKTVVVKVELDQDGALALAQFVKRVSWTDFRNNAASDDEAQAICAAVCVLQEALAEAGYAPR